MKDDMRYKDCDTYREIKRNRIHQNNMAFGDEGGVLACMDFEAELREDCAYCDNTRCPFFE